jgi:ribulose-5-phosphate 4-epimerase/fuculose-1-phosphate aldolase
VHGIVHYHAPYATAYAVKGQTLPLPTVHARRILKEIPLIAEYPDGSPELADAVAQAFENREVLGLLMVDHGLMAVGPTLQQAQYRAELMEDHKLRAFWLVDLIA